MNKRRSAKSGPSAFSLLPKKPRTTYRTLTIWPAHQLLFSFRRFNTQPKNRSKKYRQLVVYIEHFNAPVKEISIRYKRVKSKKVARYTKPRNIYFRRILPYALITLGLTGLVFFGLQITRPKSINVSASGVVPAPKTSSPISPEHLSKSRPLRVNIAKINLDVPVINVGKNADGSIETPNVLDYVVGWYKYSPTPGEIGPSVIVGHVDSYKGISVFWRLRELLPGDKIIIIRADGSRATFKIDSLQHFDQAKFPSKEVYGNINYAGLRLITCGGTFSEQTGHYNQNTVVFASLVK